MTKIATSLLVVLITASAAANPVHGPERYTGVIGSNQTQTRMFLLEAREATAFRALGDGDGDIDCELYDEHGDLVAADTDAEDGCLMTIVPLWRGPFLLQLHNAGSEASAYTLRVW